jgi:tetratricopeptide (TPR) repeat protein
MSLGWMSPRLPWSCLHVAVVLSAIGCAARPPSPVNDDAAASVRARVAAVAQADGLARQGCYQPMAEAFRTYQALLADADDVAIRRRAFDVAVLLAVRERLLGLYPGPHQDAPQQLAAGLTDPDVTLALDVLALIDWRRGTRPPTTSSRSFEAVRATMYAAHQSLLARASDDERSAVLLMHLLKAQPFAGVPPGESWSRARPAPLSFETAPWAERHVASPAAGFAWLLAQAGTTEAEWTTWFDTHPACVEALVPMADAAAASGRLMSTDAVLARALDALPAIVPARVMRGEIRTRLEDHAGALPYFSDVVRRVPEHREARLGRLVALSSLARHDEALAEADAMIALGEWYLGEAYYWKAWNLFHQRRLPEARVALVEAKRLLFNADVLYLGALIAYREEQWDDARTELLRTLDTDTTHCDARFTLGAVQLLTQAWTLAGPSFAEATDCFGGREPALSAAVAEVETANLTDAQKTALRARRQQALDATIVQKQWARYNRAVALSNSGDRDAARALAEDVAQQGGPPADAAADLLLQLGRPQRETPPEA